MSHKVTMTPMTPDGRLRTAEAYDVELSKKYMSPRDVFALARSASPSCALAGHQCKWQAIEFLFAEGALTGKNKWSALQEVEHLVRYLVDYDKTALRAALDKSLADARVVTVRMNELSRFDSRVRDVSIENCFAWEEVEYLRKVLGLPAGGG